MPAGSRILPYRSNIPKISEFVFEQVDESFFKRSMEHQDTGFIVVGGTNYGQGSSREHAALAPRWLGCRVKIARSFARIHRQNLANFGILPLLFTDEADYDAIEQGDELAIDDVRTQIQDDANVEVQNVTQGTTFTCTHDLTPRERAMVLEGSQISVVKKKFAAA